MTTHVIAHPHQDPVEEHERSETAAFGFWIYILSDCLIFASLFATYAVLHTNTFGGLSGRGLFDLPFVLEETIILLTSSFTCGLGVLAAHQGNLKRTLVFFGATFGLGLAFLTLEVSEFAHLVAIGYSWQKNAFLSSYFTLVGTHGLHVALGSVWMLLLIVQVAWKGLSSTNVRRLTLLSMFWHFLDIIWIFIFTIVYLMAFL